jgi:heptosyltransferase-2
MAAAPRNIVWLQTSFLGDIILTTAAMRVAKELFPDCKQYLVTTKIGEAALRNSELLDGIVVFDKKTFFAKSFKKVKKQLQKFMGSFEESVLLQPHQSFRSSLLAKYLKIPRITYRQTHLGSGSLARVERNAYFHEARRIGLLLEPLGVPRQTVLSSRPVIPVGELGQLAERFDDLLKFQGPLIGIAPGSKWGTKMWPVKSFAELTQQILAKTEAGVVLIGERNEKWLAREILHKTGSSQRVWDLIGETTLETLPAIMSRFAVVVSNDSAPIHFASALNIPTLAIFGATVPAMGFGPLAQRSDVAELDGLSCRPCSDHGPAVCPLGHFKCMLDLKSDVVFDKVQILLK